jgi:hypothetical protein
MDAKPTARSENLIIEELDRGVVVYDSLTQQAHALDPMAASVWRAADGHRTVSELADVTGLEKPAVVATLDQLHERGLFEAGSSVSRRAMLRRTASLGAAAIAAAPLIETVVIPTAAAHASTPTPSPPAQTLLLGILTPDNLSAVINVPTGLTAPGRYLVRRGSMKVLAPNPYAVFAITTGVNTVTFTNVTTDGTGPTYHFQLVGTDGQGHPVNAPVAGLNGLYTAIPFGSLLNIKIYYVPGP